METLEKTYKVPSAGLFGGPTEVTMRPMTTKEEKIIYTSRDMSFIEKIVKSCIVEPKDVKMSDVINILPFKLTKAQLRVLEEIDNNMEKATPMNRLLQGDVGSRKNGCKYYF